MSNGNEKNLGDLIAMANKGANAAPRYHVRRAGSDDESTIFNTYAGKADAERYACDLENLNPGVEFEIVDLETGEIVD